MENNISQKHIKMENKKAVKLTDFQKNEENPFMKQAIEGIENHVVKKYKSNSGGDKRAVVALADTETGEVFKTSFIRQIEVDEEQFTKLYLSNFAAFFDLSQAAIRVFGYFMTCMKPKNDLIIFNRKKCLEYTKYKTDKAVYKGLAELVKAEMRRTRKIVCLLITIRMELLYPPVMSIPMKDILFIQVHIISFSLIKWKPANP